MTKSFTPPERKSFNRIALSMSTKQIILGSLLGDGSLKIAKNYKNARFCERHSLVQEEYLKWKFYQLEPELKGSLCQSLPEKSSLSGKGKLIYQSAVNEKLTLLHSLTHWQNKKQIKRRWLNNLNALALAIWWCDDGSLNTVRKQGVFCTECFSYAEHLLLVRYLKIDWQIDCRIIENPVYNKEKQLLRRDYRLRFSTFDNLQAFLRLILPYIPVPSMLYKVMICFDDPKSQQRWISEIKQALPKFALEIKQKYEIPFEKYGFLIEKKTLPLGKGSRPLSFRDIFYNTAKFQKYTRSENDIVH